MLLKCQKGNNSNITQHDDIGNLKMNSDTRRNLSNKDGDHCISRATDHTGISQSFGLYSFYSFRSSKFENLIEHVCYELNQQTKIQYKLTFHSKPHSYIL